MKVSIHNFKSIKKLAGFDIKPLTIIAGVNNSGKSSLFQFLLLIKQTIKRASLTEPLVTKDEFFSISKFKDLVFNHQSENKIGISFKIESSELSNVREYRLFGMRSDEESSCIMSVVYDFDDMDNPVIYEFSLKFEVSLENNPYLQVLRDGMGYKVKVTTAHFGKDLIAFPDEFKRLENLRFESIFPFQYKVLTQKPEIFNEVFEDKNVYNPLPTEEGIFNLSPIKDFIKEFFSNVFYLSPLREYPKSEYFIDTNHSWVGVRGEFSAQILYEQRENIIRFHKFFEKGNEITFEPVDDTLPTAVNYWMCEKFGVAQNIDVVENHGLYRILITNHLGITVTINHVGFGISQLLPIVIEGLRMPVGGTLILEEPESHLHPKLQSYLFDFLYSLTLQGKTVMIETHSDHLITRMRRRLAEDKSNELAKSINLTFVTSVNGETNYEKISLDEFGVPKYFPGDFIELSNKEMAAIVEAQMKKRLARSKK